MNAFERLDAFLAADELFFDLGVRIEAQSQDTGGMMWGCELRVVTEPEARGLRADESRAFFALDWSAGAALDMALDGLERWIDTEEPDIEMYERQAPVRDVDSSQQGEPLSKE